MNHGSRIISMPALAFAMFLASVGDARTVRADAQEQANRIHESTGFTGGLIVHVDCGDGARTAALKANEQTVVHGLCVHADEVISARQHIRTTGTYGPVAVELWHGPNLPYADNMVNLLVAPENAKIPREEILRVLCPGGQAVFLSEQAELTKISKPSSAGLDQWTHFLHDSGNNAVARAETWVSDFVVIRRFLGGTSLSLPTAWPGQLPRPSPGALGRAGSYIFNELLSDSQQPVGPEHHEGDG